LPQQPRQQLSSWCSSLLLLPPPPPPPPPPPLPLPLLLLLLLLLQVFNGTTQDVEFTIEADQLEAWINDVKRIFKMDLWENGKAR
jgi:hypothetical protein